MVSTPAAPKTPALRHPVHRCDRTATWPLAAPGKARTETATQTLDMIGDCESCPGNTVTYPGARLRRIDGADLSPVRLEKTDRFLMLNTFCDEPRGYVESVRLHKSLACDIALA